MSSRSLWRPTFRASITAVAAVLAAALVVHAGVTWAAEGTLTTSAVSPPVHFEKGEGASNMRHFRNFSISEDGTRFSMDVKARSGAETVVKDALRAVSTASTETPVVFTASPVTDTRVDAFTWTARNASGEVAVVDYLDDAPAAAFRIPAGDVVKMDLRIELAEGARGKDEHVTFDLVTEVSP